MFCVQQGNNKIKIHEPLGNSDNDQIPFNIVIKSDKTKHTLYLLTHFVYKRHYLGLPVPVDWFGKV